MGCRKLSYYQGEGLEQNRFLKIVGSEKRETEHFFGVDYYPYGKVLREWNPQAEKYLTTHHERDTETGLDYRGARYYDSDVARFLSLDPKAVDYPSWSAYNYVFSNPVTFIDPDGKDPQGGGGNNGNRAHIQRNRVPPSAGTIQYNFYNPISQNNRIVTQYFEVRKSVLDPQSTSNNKYATTLKTIVEAYDDAINQIKTRKEWSVNKDGKLEASNTTFIVEFNSPALQSKFNALQGEYEKEFNNMVKGTYSEEEFKNLSPAVVGVRIANAVFQLGDSPMQIIIKAFQASVKDNSQNFEVTEVIEKKAVVYDANKK